MTQKYLISDPVTVIAAEEFGERPICSNVDLSTQKSNSTKDLENQNAGNSVFNSCKLFKICNYSIFVFYYEILSPMHFVLTF